MTTRRWDGFNDLDTVKQNLSEVKTFSDLLQLSFDIDQSKTNLTYFNRVSQGLYAVVCVAGERNYQHVFMTPDKYSQCGNITPDEGDCLTVLIVE
jgi:hypothetical protein